MPRVVCFSYEEAQQVFENVYVPEVWCIDQDAMTVGKVESLMEAREFYGYDSQDEKLILALDTETSDPEPTEYHTAIAHLPTGAGKSTMVKEWAKARGIKMIEPKIIGHSHRSIWITSEVPQAQIDKMRKCWNDMLKDSGSKPFKVPTWDVLPKRNQDSDMMDALKYSMFKLPGSEDDFEDPPAAEDANEMEEFNNYGKGVTHVPPSEVEQWRKEGRCPKCGELGPYIKLLPTCSKHGPY